MVSRAKENVPMSVKVLVKSIISNFEAFALSLFSERPLISSLFHISNGFGNKYQGQIYDAFHYAGERQLAVLRMTLLSPYVAQFFIIEADRTFTGKDKELTFLNQTEYFEEFLHKITYLPLLNSPKTRDEVRAILHNECATSQQKRSAYKALNANESTLGMDHWTVEYYQKEMIHEVLERVPSSGVVVISDVDEVWDPKMNVTIRENKLYLGKLKSYTYFINLRNNLNYRHWTGPLIAFGSTIQERLKTGQSINGMRTHNKYFRRLILRGGWHFSFVGGHDAILKKLEAYGHQEYNTADKRENLRQSISNGEDIRSSSAISWMSSKHLPDEVIEYAKAEKSLLVEKFPSSTFMKAFLYSWQIRTNRKSG